MSTTRTLPNRQPQYQTASQTHSRQTLYKGGNSTLHAWLLALIGSLALSSCGSPGGASPDDVCAKALNAIEKGDWETYGSYLVEERKNKFIAKIIGFANLSTTAEKEKRKQLDEILKAHNVVDPDEVEGDLKPKNFTEAANLAVSKVGNTNVLLRDLIKFIYEASDAEDIETWITFTMPRKGGKLGEISSDPAGDKAWAIVNYEKGGNLRIALKKEGERWFIEFFEKAP